MAKSKVIPSPLPQESNKALIKALGYAPKDNTSGVWVKVYAGGYRIEVDFAAERFNYGDLIRYPSIDFSKPEHWVVLECVDRLIVKGYSPKCIILEQMWATGHGTSGRLDILITRADDTAYMMIECKTSGAEFEKAYQKLKRDGGQVFTYFQQDTKADVLVLYASSLTKKGIVQHVNWIVKIEEDYRLAGNVKDFYERWNKLPKNNGVFDDWVKPYDFQSKALTPQSLKEIEEEHSSFIFNRFLEILRHNVVSDKPNAFNKIFTLFLCKIYDEKSKRETEELDFQWLEGVDDHISFQKRLTDLYRKGMKEFLDKEVSDLSDNEFEEKFSLHLVNEDVRRSILAQFTDLRLKKNNEFAIKEVFDETSFADNAKVVKDVVELLQEFRIRYNTRHQYLSDFFELLLTTGLKQESGQFFTPVPIAQFIIKSIPLDQIVRQKLAAGETDNLLPCIIDYAAGSGHFLTESMHEVQRLLSKETADEYLNTTAKQIKKWQIDHFDWAIQYVYGIEKDYRLVKVGKVGCYLHGDGLAKVIHGDGLANFTTAKEYQGRLKHRDKYFPQDNKQFDIVLSNPPYSVAAFKGELKNVENDFELYSDLTDQSSQIECLFIERTKHLLKDGGLAGIILPSSILTNAGIYSRSREIILQYFDIVALAELGGNTFMATTTNTVTLFLRRRKNDVSVNVRLQADRFFDNHQDVSIHGIEKPVSKYVAHVWEGVSFDDYLTLVKGKPNAAIKDHPLYQEYTTKIVAKTLAEHYNILRQREQEKLFYFILAYSQKVVVVKSGEQKSEKQFLGYEFSHRRGNEGIHAVQRGKSIDECTRLFDAEVFDNPEKASTYIYKAFQGDHTCDISPLLSKNVERHNLVDMLVFNRSEFEKTIAITSKKKVAVDSKWPLVRLDKVAKIVRGVTYAKSDQTPDVTTNIILTAENITLTGEFELNKQVYLYPTVVLDKEKRLMKNDIFICFSSGSKNHLGKVAFISDDTPYYSGGFMGIIRALPDVVPKYIYFLLNGPLRQLVRDFGSGSNINNLSSVLSELDIPLPPLDVQKRIVAEVELIENEEQSIKAKIGEQIEQVQKLVKGISNVGRVAELCSVVDDSVDPTKSASSTFINIGLENIEGHTGRFLDRPNMLGSEIQSKKRKFTTGNVLYGKLRPYLNKVAIADVDGICSTDILVLKTEHPLLLKYVLLSQEFNLQTFELMNGTSLPRVKKDEFLSLTIPVPKAIDRKRITAKIEAIESKISEFELTLSALPERKEVVLRQFL